MGFRKYMVLFCLAASLLGAFHCKVVMADPVKERLELTLYEGEITALKHKVYPNKGIGKNIEFMVADQKIARVTSQGLVKALSQGTTKITVREKGVAAVRKEVQLNVKKRKQVESIDVPESCVTVFSGGRCFLRTKIQPADAYNNRLYYRSERTDIVRVAADGTLFGLSPGITNIKIYARDGSNVTARVRVRVLDLKDVVTERYNGIMAAQGMCCSQDALYYTILGNFDESNSAFIKRVDLVSGETKSVLNSSLGHANDLTYDPVTDAVQCIKMDKKGGIYVINAKTLKPDGEFSMYEQLNPKISRYTDVYAAAFDRDTDCFIYAVSGGKLGFAICDRERQVKNMVAINNPGYTSQGICAAGGRIYKAWSDSKQHKNYISVYDYDGKFLEKAEVSFDYEIESICIQDNTIYMLFNRKGYRSYVIKSCSMDALFMCR